MAIFNILEPSDLNPDKVVLVREGFDAWALLLTVVWALWHRLWVVASLLFAAFVAIAVAEDWYHWHWGISLAAETGLAMVFGFEASRFRVQSLQRAGYRLTGLIQASSAAAAELQYFSGRAPARLGSAPVSYRAHRGADDTLGLFGSR
jgi:hypothetical protein